jgi:hypothetical protein
VVHDEAFAAQQHVEPAIAEAPPFLGERPQPFAQTRVIDPAGSVTDRHPHATDHPARPPLAHLVRLPEMGDGLSLHSGRHHFFDSRSFSAALSRHRVRQQLLQPSVLPLKLLQPPRFGYVQAAELALPGVEGRLADPVLAAQIGRLRTQHVSRKTPMICSSVNRFRFIVWSSFKGQTQVQSG